MNAIQLIGFSEKQTLAAREVASSLGFTVCEQADLRIIAKKGDELSVSGNAGEVTLTYRKPNDLFRALSFLPDFLKNGTPVHENARFDTLCYMADDSRNSVMTVASTLLFILIV